MKLLSIEINCFRGIKHLELNFNGNNAVIYGDNGTGKSGVIDAIDFLIKGDITRLSGSGSANLDLAKHGKYVTEDLSDAWVKAKVKLPGYSKEIEIKRFLKNPTTIVCDSEYSKDFEAIKNISSYNAHYLSRKEILQFINSTEQERAKSIEKLLNIISLEKNRTALQKARKAIEDTLKSKQTQEKMCENDISTKLGVESGLWLDVINELRGRLGAKMIDTIDSNAIISDLSLSKSTTTSSELINFIDRLSNIYKLFNEGESSLVSRIKEAKLNYEKILIKKEYDGQLDLITLYEQGQKLLTTDSCPLCGQAIADTALFKKKLQDKIDNLKSTKQIAKDYGDSLQGMRDQLSSVIQHLDFINIEKLGEYVDTCALNTLRADICSLLAVIQQDKFNSDYAVEFLCKDYPTILHDCYISELVKKSAKVAVSEKEAAYKTLIDIGSKYKLLSQLHTEVSLLQGQADRAKVLYNSYIAAQTSVLNSMYDSIQERFSHLYRIIHETDESDFFGRFERKPAKLELNVKFKDGQMYPPNAVHSEGHQDSMGICLFFALSEKISNDILNIILLDDVVMSIDVDHRKNFCKVLKEEFPNKQFIITTHDYIWRKELESCGVVAKRNVFHFKAWDISHGPYVEIGSNIWDIIEKELNNGEKHEAIGQLRYYMEEFFGDICARHKLLVPYSITGKWSLEEVIAPVGTFYRKTLEKAKKSAQSFGKDTVKIDELLQKQKDKLSALNVDRWTINPSTHFTTWAQNLSITELKSVYIAVKEYCESFECPSCHSLLTVNMDMNEPRIISCDCGEVSFSCIKKN